MKKKLLVVVLVVLLVLPASVFAGDLFGLSLGGAGLFLGNIPLNGELEFDPEDFLDIENYFIGGELCFNVSIVELSTIILPVEFGESEGAYYVYGLAIPSLGVSVNVLEMLRLGVGVATWGEFLANSNGEFMSTFSYFLPVIIKPSLHAQFGPVSLGAYALLFPDISFDQILDPEFDPTSVTFAPYANVGISARIALL